MLYVILLVLVTACQTTIPNVRVYKIIPFIDGPEAVYVDSLTHKEGWLNAKETAKKIPFFLALDPEGWSAIKIQWYEGCRYARDQNGCNAQVDSVDTLMRTLDNIARVTVGGFH